MEHTRYPISLNWFGKCTGKCQRATWHERRVYPDTEYFTCTECHHKFERVFKGNIEDIIYIEELIRVSCELERLITQINNHKWSKNIGKKDKEFIDRMKEFLLFNLKRIKDSINTH